MAPQLASVAAGARSASSHNILKIPLETVERIAEVGDDEGLLRLRLVCRKASYQVMRT